MSEIHVLSGEITENSVEPIIYSMLNHTPDYTDESDIFQIALNTIGGSIVDGIALIGVMEVSPFYTSITGFGSIFSMGIPLIASADERKAHHLATFMYHAPTCAYQGKANEVQAAIDHAKQQEDMINNILKKKTNITTKQLAYSKNNEWYFTAQEALKYGIIDEVIYEHPWHYNAKK